MRLIYKYNNSVSIVKANNKERRMVSKGVYPNSVEMAVRLPDYMLH